MAEAQRRGTILAIIRLGNIDLENRASPAMNAVPHGGPMMMPPGDAAGHAAGSDASAERSDGTFQDTATDAESADEQQLPDLAAVVHQVIRDGSRTPDKPTDHAVRGLFQLRGSRWACGFSFASA